MPPSVLQNIDLLSVLTGCDGDMALETIGQMALAAEARVVGDLCQRQPAQQHFLRPPDAHIFQVSMRRQAHFLTEHAQQIKRTPIDKYRQLLQGDILGKMLVEITADAPDFMAFGTDRFDGRARIGMAQNQMAERPQKTRFLF